MERREEELILALLPQYPELKTAYEEHTRLKSAVERLSSKSHLSADEEMEKKDLQKRKLAEKDKMMHILSNHRGGQAAR